MKKLILTKKKLFIPAKKEIEIKKKQEQRKKPWNRYAINTKTLTME